MTTIADQLDDTSPPTDQHQLVYLAKSLLELLETTKPEL